MPDMTLVTQLIADSTQFTLGTERARSANGALSGSVNSIIGQLERQKKAYENAGRSTLDWIEADKKASDEVKEHAKALLAEVDAINKVAAARKAAAASGPDRLSAMTKPDYFGRGLDRLETQREIDAKKEKDAAERDRNDPFLRGMAKYQTTNDPFAVGLRRMEQDKRDREEKARLAEEQAKVDAERDAKDPFLQGMAKHKRENGPFEVGLQRLSEQESQKQGEANARKAAGTSGDKWREEDAADKEHADAIRKHNAEIKKARLDEDAEEKARIASTRKNSASMAHNRRDDANVQKQLEDQGYFKRGKKEPAEAKSKGGWAGVEGFRAIEDFAQGSAYGGLRGGLVGASNNISQMGAAYGAAGAMAGSALSTVIVLGSTLYETWRKAATGGHEATAALAEYDRMTSSVLEHTKQMHQLQLDARGIRNESSFSGATQSEQSLRDDIERQQQDIKAKEEARKDLLAGMGASGMTAQGLDNEVTRREETVWGLRRNAASAQAAQLSDEALNIENRAKIREQERENTRANEVLFEKRRLLQQAEQVSLARGQHEADVSEERRRAHERGGAGPLTEWQQMDKERAFANEQNAKDKAKFESGQKWMQSRGEDLMLSGLKSDKDRAAYQAQKEHAESLRRSEEAEKRGIMTPAERSQMDLASTAKRDKDIRASKYGDLQADGTTGFTATDVKSTQGFNAMVKAARYAEQDKTITELKRNGDITQEIATAITNGITITNLAPVPVVNF